MRRRGAGFGVLTAAAMLLIAAPASAGTLDQQQALHVNLSQRIYAEDGGMPTQEQSLAQTFTAGITGDLDQVDLYLQKFGAPAAPLTVEIRDVVGVNGPPGNTVFATETVPASEVVSVGYSFNQVLLDPPVPVVAGTQYAIVAWTAAVDGADYYWGHHADNPYAAGEARTQFAPEASPPVPGQWGPGGATIDRTFKTYVEGADADGDGVQVPTDCDDANSAIHPGATDVPGNGIDEDCSGADTPAPGGGGAPVPPPITSPAATGQRAAALKKCKKKKGAKRKKCRKRANKLPI